MQGLPPLPKRSCLAVLCAICFVSQARAFSSGAGACLAGQASVFGLHLTNPTTGTLDQGGYTISIDSKLAHNGDEVSILPRGLEFDIVVAGSRNFKGILVRVDGSTSDQVVPGTSSSNLLKAASCSGTGAVTHVDPTPKNNIVATVSLDSPGKHDVDITLVVQNSGGVSEFYYSSVSVDVQEVAVGDEICVEGYVMDRFCIELGTLLDNPSVVTLEEPDRHSVHCLVDVQVCFNSGYEILIDPGPGEALYRRGWSVNDAGNTLLRNMARQIGICDTCDVGGLLEEGFRVSMNCTVTDLGSGDIPPTCFLTHAMASTDPEVSFCPQNQEAASVVPSTDPSPMPTSSPSVKPSGSVAPTKVPTNVLPKKDIPNDLSKDDTAKLFNDEERGNLQRKRRRLKSTQ